MHGMCIYWVGWDGFVGERDYIDVAERKERRIEAGVIKNVREASRRRRKEVVMNEKE